jgi:hypothetical protein
MSTSVVTNIAAYVIVDSGTATGNLALPSNVAVDDLVVVLVTKYSPSADAFLAADCTKAAGTATIGAVSLARNENRATGNLIYGGIWYATVTGAGSLTMQVGGGVGGSAFLAEVIVFRSTLGAMSSDQATGNNNSTGAPDSGNLTMGGDGIRVAALATDTSAITAHTLDATNGWTLLEEEEDGGSHMTGACAYALNIASGATDSAAWSAPSGGPWALAYATFKEAAAGLTAAQQIGIFDQQLSGQMVGLVWK